MTEILNKETGELTQTVDEPSGDFVAPELAPDPDDDAIAAEMTPDTDDQAPDDDADDDELEQPAAPPELAPHHGPTQQEVERAFKQVETAATAYAKKVAAALPADAFALSPCPLCADHIPAFVDLDIAGRLPEDVKQATLIYLGFAREQEYEPDPSTEQCRVCKGKGKTSTGSKVATNDTRRCANCNGYGYYPPPGSDVASAAPADPDHMPVGEQGGPISLDEVDPTGEPRILPDGRPNPNYMKWPQGKVLVQPWGVTAGLRAQDAT